jgi:hypothetical protein
MWRCFYPSVSALSSAFNSGLQREGSRGNHSDTSFSQPRLFTSKHQNTKYLDELDGVHFLSSPATGTPTGACNSSSYQIWRPASQHLWSWDAGHFESLSTFEAVLKWWASQDKDCCSQVQVFPSRSLLPASQPLIVVSCNYLHSKWNICKKR